MRRAPELEREIGKPPEQPLWRCEACGHVQVHPIPSPEQIASYYQPAPRTGRKRKGVGWAGGASQAAPSYLRRLLRAVAARPSGTLLDVGFGSGSFLRAAHAMGFRVTGLDPRANRFEPDFPCELKEGRLRPGLFPDGSFDVIAAHHVLEHVEDFPHALRVIHGLLRPGGYLLIELPHDIRSLTKRLKRVLLRRAYTKFTRLQHLRFFTVRSLRASLERTGFQVELCRSIPSRELLRPPRSLLLIPLSPLERWTGRGHHLEAIARKS
jgi:SAM-dependent methyltransferase